MRSSHLTCLTVCVCVVQADELGRIRQSGDQKQHQRLQIRGEFCRDGQDGSCKEGGGKGRWKERWTCVQDKERNAKTAKVQVRKGGCWSEKNSTGKERMRCGEKVRR